MATYRDKWSGAQVSVSDDTAKRLDPSQFEPVKEQKAETKAPPAKKAASPSTDK